MTVGTINGTSGHRLVNILKGECYLTEPGLKAYTTTMDKLFEKKKKRTTTLNPGRQSLELTLRHTSMLEERQQDPFDSPRVY